MKTIIAVLGLICVPFYSAAINITFEITETNTWLSTQDTSEQLNIGTPSTYTVEYVIDDQELNNWFYSAEILSGDLVGNSDVYNTFFQLLHRPSVFPGQGYFEQFLTDNYQPQDQRDVDFYYLNDYTDVRLDIWEHTLLPTHQSDPTLSDFNDTAAVGFKISTNNEVAWGKDENGVQTGQTYEWTSSIDYRELFADNPYNGYASYDDLIAMLIKAMDQGSEFFFQEQIFIAEFSRDAGNQNTQIDWTDFSSHTFLQTNGNARIVGLSFPTQVSEPATFGLFLVSSLFVFRRRIMK